MIVFEFLQPDRVTHVATDAVQLVREDGIDLFTLGVLFDPPQHIVEHLAVSAALGRFGDDKLSDDGPAVFGRLITHGTQLCVDAVTFSLFAGRNPRPYYDIHALFPSFARMSSSPNRFTFIRISKGWTKNPAGLDSVANVPAHYRVVAGNTVRPATPTERTTIDTARLPVLKRAWQKQMLVDLTEDMATISADKIDAATESFRIKYKAAVAAIEQAKTPGELSAVKVAVTPTA